MLRIAYFFAGGFGLALLLVPACKHVAQRTGLLARPSVDRWHKKPTPLLGGVAVFAITMVALPVLGFSPGLLPLIGAGAVMFAVGLVDDVRHLRPSTKLVAQILVAAVLVFFGFRLGWVRSLTLDVVLTMVWIVGITNAFNLLDNMDGLCAGISLIAGVSILAGFVAIDPGLVAAAYLALMLGSVAGFLVHNIHPAAIFLGDSGSLFIGITLASVTLQMPRRDLNVLGTVAAPVLVMLIPIFDTVLVTLSRLLSGRRPSQGGRDHSSHRLVAIGLPERQAVTVLWTLALLGALTAWTVESAPPEWSSVALVLFLSSMGLFAAFLSRVRVYQGDDMLLARSGKLTPFVFQFMHKRRVAEVVLDFCLITVAYYSAYRLRFESDTFVLFFPRFLESLPVVLAIQLGTLFAVGAYRGLWQHFSIMDGVTFAKGVLFGTVLSAFALLYLFRFEDYSRAVFVIYGMLLMLLLTGSRASFRVMGEFARRRGIGVRVLLYGAGFGGAMVLKELTSPNRPAARIVGFVDDDVQKQQTQVLGYPVLGGYETLVALVSAGAVDQVVVSTTLIDRQMLQGLQDMCSRHGVLVYRLNISLEAVTAAS